MVQFIQLLCGCGKSAPDEINHDDQPIKQKHKPPTVETDSNDSHTCATDTRPTPCTSPEPPEPLETNDTSPHHLAPLIIPNSPTRALVITPSPVSNMGMKVPQLNLPTTPTSQYIIPESPTVTSFTRVFNSSPTAKGGKPEEGIPPVTLARAMSVQNTNTLPHKRQLSRSNTTHNRQLSRSNTHAITQDHDAMQKLISLQVTTQKLSMSITKEEIQNLSKQTTTTTTTTKALSPWAGVASTSPRRSSAPAIRVTRRSIVQPPAPAVVIPTGPISLEQAESILISTLEVVQYVRGGMRACVIKYDHELKNLYFTCAHTSDYIVRIDEITEVFTGKRAFAVAGSAFRVSPWSPFFSQKIHEVAACFTLTAHSKTNGHGRFDVQCPTPQTMHMWLQALHLVSQHDRTLRAQHEAKAANPTPAPTPVSSPSNASIALSTTPAPALAPAPTPVQVESPPIIIKLITPSSIPEETIHIQFPCHEE